MVTPLPAALLRQPFTPEDVRCWQLPPAVLRRAALHTPTRGVRVAEVPETILARVDAFDVGLPKDAAFSHVTAAQLWDLPLPRGLEDRQILDVMRATGLPQTRRLGCHGRRGSENRSIWAVHGIRVIGLADTWCDLGELATGPDPTMDLDDLVIVGDAIVRRLDESAIALQEGVEFEAAATCQELWPRPGDPGRAELMALLARASARQEGVGRGPRPRAAAREVTDGDPVTVDVPAGWVPGAVRQRGDPRRDRKLPARGRPRVAGPAGGGGVPGRAPRLHQAAQRRLQPRLGRRGP